MNEQYGKEQLDYPLPQDFWKISTSKVVLTYKELHELIEAECERRNESARCSSEKCEHTWASHNLDILGDICVKCGERKPSEKQFSGYSTETPIEQHLETLDKDKILYEIRMCTTTSGEFLGGEFAERMEKFGRPANSLEALDEEKVFFIIDSINGKKNLSNLMPYTNRDIAHKICEKFGRPKTLTVEEIQKIINKQINIDPGINFEKVSREIKKALDT